MDFIKELIQQHSTIFIIGGLALVIFAGIIIKKIKALAILFFIIAAFIFYFVIQKGDSKKMSIDKLKQNTKEKIMDNIKK